jgi:SAM-dependent methyltransferase
MIYLAARRMKEHWEQVYDQKKVEELGWYESNPGPSLKLIELCKLHKSARILNVGAGATTLVDELLDLGYKNMIANDISPAALEELRQRLGPRRSREVDWIVDDLTNPDKLNKLIQIDLWHDRAVLHFFNDQNSQEAYFALLRYLVKPGGFAIIAAFNLNGAQICSGLPVFRYDARMLQGKIGSDFTLRESFDYTYTQPAGDTREYIYTLFQRSSI